MDCHSPALTTLNPDASQVESNRVLTGRHFADVRFVQTTCGHGRANQMALKSRRANEAFPIFPGPHIGDAICPEIVPVCFRRSTALSFVVNGYRGHSLKTQHLTPPPIPRTRESVSVSLHRVTSVTPQKVSPIPSPRAPYSYLPAVIYGNNIGDIYGIDTGAYRGQRSTGCPRT